MPQKKINSQRREVPLFWLLDFPLRVNNKYLYRGDNRLRHGWNVWTSLQLLLHLVVCSMVLLATRWCFSWCILSDYWLRTYSKISWECFDGVTDDVTDDDNDDVTRWSFLVPFAAEDLAKSFDATSKRDTDCILDFEFFHLSTGFDYSRFEIVLPKILYFFPIHDARVQFLIIQIQFLEETPLDQKSTWKFIFRMNTGKFEFLILKLKLSFSKGNYKIYY